MNSLSPLSYPIQDIQLCQMTARMSDVTQKKFPEIDTANYFCGVTEKGCGDGKSHKHAMCGL